VVREAAAERPARAPRRRAGRSAPPGLWPRGYLFTIAGIAVGIGGLVALGGLAERISRFIEGGHRFVEGQLSVAGAGIGSGAGFTAGGLLRRSAIEAIRRVPGVAVVQPQVVLPVDSTSSALFTVNQELVLGLDLTVPAPNRSYPTLPIARGRALTSADRGRAVVGVDFAAARSLLPGGPVRIGAREFQVVGILERLFTAPDRFVIVPIEDARELVLAMNSPLSILFGPGGPLGPEDLNTGAAVGWEAGLDPDRVAERIRGEVAGVHVAAPGQVARQLAASTAFFSWLLAGVGGIGLLVGGLSLSNTMAAATFERIRDFGIKQALGATDLRLLGEVLRESFVVSVSGAAIGTTLAVGAGMLVNGQAAQAGYQLFLFSPRILAFALVFAAALGAIAGTYATVRILRVPPAEAIRRGA
jgi:putative ABC transport system permease protein